MRRLIGACLLLFALSACGVLAQAPVDTTAIPTSSTSSNAATPGETSLAALATATLEPTAIPTQPPDLPALWLIDGAQDRQAALDPQTGRVLNQLPADYTAQVFTRDGRRRYSLVDKAVDGRWHVSLRILDLTRSANPQQVLLSDDVPLTTGSTREVTNGQLLLSQDERRLYVTQLQLLDQRWHTRVWVVDLTTGAATRLAEVSNRVQAFAPVAAMVLSADERRLFIVENPMREPPAAKSNPAFVSDPALWFTSITALDLSNGKVERVVDVPGDVRADGFWLNIVAAPDGKTLYLLQDIVRNSQRDGYRFVAFDVNQEQIILTRLVEASSAAELGCATWGLRFTADGRYLYGYCGADHPNRPAGYIQYLDTQTGLVDPKAVLESQTNPGNPASAYGVFYTLASPDKRLVYIISWRSREVFAFDVGQRKVMRGIVLSDAKQSTSWNPVRRATAWLLSSFVSTASAKMYAQPGALLSPDGTHLYLVDIEDFEHGNGVWAVETSTLKPIGHWLTGKDIYGIQLSADGRELFAASPSDSGVAVLDALTGGTRRVLKPVQTVFKPMGFVTAQMP